MHDHLALFLSLSLPLFLSLTPVLAADWYVAPDGKPTNAGTHQSPWDIASALDGTHAIAPGDTIWLKGGTYKHAFELLGKGWPIKLAGTAESPIHIRAARGERVTIDGGLNIQRPSDYVWLWDVEIIVSEPRPPQAVPPDPTYRVVNRPWGGLEVYTGKGCKYINLVIHDNCQGISFWSGATDSEVHGCLIYDNGWLGTDRGHGHAIYTQNKDGIKTISDCIMTGGFGYTMHAYGSSRAFIDNYLVEGNIAYNGGTFLIGGGSPSHGIRCLSNYLYGCSLQVGYTSKESEDCEVRNNIVANAGLTIQGFKTVVNEGNQVVPKGAPRPPGATVILRPNKYARNRANLAVYNWEKRPTVAVDASTFLKTGDKYRLINPKDFFGKPVLEGTCDGKPVNVPVEGEFAAFVVLKGEAK